MKKYLIPALVIAVLVSTTGVSYVFASTNNYDLNVDHQDDQNAQETLHLSVSDSIPQFLGTDPNTRYPQLWTTDTGSGLYMTPTSHQMTLHDIPQTGVTNLTSNLNDINSTISSLTSSITTENAAISAINAHHKTASSATRSIVTGTGATGFQVSTTTDADVRYSTTIVTTSTILGSQNGTIVLEIAPTNSATSTDWGEIGRCTNGTSYTLAVAIQGISTQGCQITGFVPSGYYAKLRSINNSGTPSYSYNSGQEVLQ